MGLGASLFLIAIGAILAFAVHVTDPNGIVNIHSVGLILLVVGIIGALVSAAFWSSWGGWRRSDLP